MCYQFSFLVSLLYIWEMVYRLFFFCIYSNAYKTLVNFYEHTLLSFL